MSNNQIMNESILPITVDNVDFNIDISIGNDIIKISLKPLIEDIPFFYNYESTLEDLGKINKIFAVFNTLEEVKKFIYEFASKKENIKIINENDEKIIIQINYSIGTTINKSLNITFEKIITDNKKMIEYLTNYLNFYKNNLYCITPYTSKLIKHISDLELIKTGIKNFDNSKKIKIILLFRASRDGDTIKAFHDKVDGISPTISLIQTKTNFIFGGFTDHAWDSESRCTKTNNTFMFSFNKKKIYVGKNGGSICCHNGAGPWFCDGSGVIGDNYFRTKNSYELDLKTNNGSFDGFSEEFELVGGVQNFTVNEVEVFKVEYI